MQTVWGAMTDSGGHRQVNEDAVLAAPPVFIVADGMGGHIYGALASACVVQAFEEFSAGLDPSLPVQPGQIHRVIARAQQLIRAGVHHAGTPARVPAPASQGAPLAGSTVAGAVLTTHQGAPYWLMFNVGDSRIYRYHDDGLVQISVDHSVVQELVDAGVITSEAARSHPERNIITRAVDTSHAAEVDFWMLNASGAQRVLLCSDGLTAELTNEQICRTLARRHGPQQACQDLLHQAVDGGAQDNVSVVVVDVLANDAAPVRAPRSSAGIAASADLPDLADTRPRTGADPVRK